MLKLELRMCSIGIGAIACLALASISTQRGIAKDDAYSDMDSALFVGKFEDSQAACDRASYSKAYSTWLKDIQHGRTASAEQQWALVLKEAKGAEDIRPLLRTTNARLMFSEDADVKLSTFDYFESILCATQKAVGPDHVFVACIEDYLSDLYKNNKMWDKAVAHGRRTFAIEEKRLGAKNPKLAKYLKDLANKLIAAEKYDEAMPLIKRCIALSKTDSSMQQKALSMEAECKRKSKLGLKGKDH